MLYGELCEHIEALLPNAVVTIDYRDGGIIIQDTGFKLDLDWPGDDLDNTPIVDRPV